MRIDSGRVLIARDGAREASTDAVSFLWISLGLICTVCGDEIDRRLAGVSNWTDVEGPIRSLTLSGVISGGELISAESLCDWTDWSAYAIDRLGSIST
jgi:hypothetical protein